MLEELGSVKYPLLYEINTRVYLTELSVRLGRRATLDDILDSELERLAALGFAWVWFLGAWQTGAAAREISRTNPECRAECESVLPGLRDEDIAGSCFAIQSYTVHSDLGGNAAMLRLRERLHNLGMKLLLDFVPNHVAPDHRWTAEHPEYFVHGPDGAPAQGRDPYFPSWSDTLQLNYGHAGLQAAMRAELMQVAMLCDGVRCDMAMLILPEVFLHTWGIAVEPFWPGAIASVRERQPGFLFLAEVYWDLELTMQQQGFDYAYDKSLYDHLRERNAALVRAHFCAGLDYQRRLARFLENHDEPRAAEAFPAPVHDASAVVAFLSPGLRFFHQGQFEGRRRHIPVQLNRAAPEAPDAERVRFYDRLLRCLRHPALCDGDWQLLESAPAWEGNRTHGEFIAFFWRAPNGQRIGVAVNYSGEQAQCFLQLPVSELNGRRWWLIDLMSDARYERDGSELAARGLYLDMPAWGYHVFQLSA